MSGGDGSARGVTALLDDLADDAGPPRRNGELVFDSLWESRAFGLALALSDGGLYEWEEFRQRLIARIGEWEREGEDRDAWSYYRHWMSALEDLLVEKGALTMDEIEASTAEIAARPKEADHDQPAVAES